MFFIQVFLRIGFQKSLLAVCVYSAHYWFHSQVNLCCNDAGTRVGLLPHLHSVSLAIIVYFFAVCDRCLPGKAAIYWKTTYVECVFSRVYRRVFGDGCGTELLMQCKSNLARGRCDVCRFLCVCFLVSVCETLSERRKEQCCN